MGKQKVFSLLICVFLLLAGAQMSFANGIRTTSVDSTIVIDPLPNPGHDKPHSPAVIPISASLQLVTSSVLLTFSYNLGVIDVEIQNTTTDTYVSGTIETQFLCATIPVTGGSGHYTLLFILPSGKQYFGEFNI